MKFYIIENLLRAERSPEISLPLPTDFSSKLSLFFNLKKFKFPWNHPKSILVMSFSFRG